LSRGEAETRIFRIATGLSLLGVTALCALGRFRQGLALTLGAAVAIVAAVWLSDVVGRVLVPRPQKANEQDRGFNAKLTLKALLRYAVVGFALWGAVRWVPDELPWLLAGLSAVVAAVAVEGILEAGGFVGDGTRGPGPTAG